MVSGPLTTKLRPPGFYETYMLSVRVMAQHSGMTQQEIVTTLASLLGLEIARLNPSIEGKLASLDEAMKMANTACMGREAVLQGLGFPVKSGHKPT